MKREHFTLGHFSSLSNHYARLTPQLLQEAEYLPVDGK